MGCRMVKAHSSAGSSSSNGSVVWAGRATGALVGAEIGSGVGAVGAGTGEGIGFAVGSPGNTVGMGSDGLGVGMQRV